MRKVGSIHTITDYTRSITSMMRILDAVLAADPMDRIFRTTKKPVPASSQDRPTKKSQG